MRNDFVHPVKLHLHDIGLYKNICYMHNLLVLYMNVNFCNFSCRPFTSYTYRQTCWTWNIRFICQHPVHIISYLHGI